MGNISFGGLASGLDSGALIQQLLSLESRPITLLTQQRTKLQSQVGAYQDLNTRLSGLENAAFELTQISNLVGRKATSSDSDTLVATANGNATPGSYQVTVERLASSSRRQTASEVGQGNGIGGISDASGFSSETLSEINTNKRLRTDLGEGTFFVNGQSVLLTTTDTLDDLFGKISTATGGQVTAQLVSDPAKGGQVIQLNSTSAITVASGTSNFLSAFKLDTASYSPDTDSLVSSDAVNTAQTGVSLDAAEANLAQTVGSGQLTINGTTISYNGAEDSLDSILQRINNATASGVRASYSSLGGGRVSLASKDNGPLAIQISDSGNLAAALGLTAATSQVLGQSAQIRVDGGPIQSFNKNTGIQAAGLEGLVLDLRDDNPGDSISITVDADGAKATEKVQNFVTQFNQVIKRINELTVFDTKTGTKGLLLGDFTVNNIKDRLYRSVFERVGGLSGANSLGSLSELGLSTGAIGSQPGAATELQLDMSKLQAALESNPTRVAQLLGAEPTETGGQGIMQNLKGYLDGLSNATGVFAQREKIANSRIDGLDDRIEQLNARLTKRQAILENQFTSLERTISRLQSQQQSLSSLFS